LHNPFNGRPVKNLLLDLLGIMLPISLVFILYSPVMLQSGIPFYGDNTYYACSSISFHSNFYRSLFPIGTIPLTLFSYSIPLQVLVYLLGAELGVKSFIIIVCSLPGILSYFAIAILMKEFFKTKKLFTRISSVVGSLFYMLVFCGGIGNAGSATIWPYLTFPISLALLILFLRTGAPKALLFFGVFSILGNTQPIWLYLMLISSLLYIVIELTTSIGRRKQFERVFFALGILIGINFFWISPLIKGYISSAGGIFQSYTTEKLISFDGMRFLSHWNLLDVIMVGEREYYFFWLHPQNYGPLNAIIPILAAASILIFRRHRYVLFMALILVVGIFLTKGVWEPGGYLYYLIASNLPYGGGAILRNPCKFVPLVTFPYAFLIGLFVAKSYEKLGSFKPKRHNVHFSRFRSVLIGGLTLLILSPITYGNLLDLQVYTWPRYKPVYIPETYNEVNSWISRQEGNFKVMWIPSSGAYVWKPYIITAFPDPLSPRPAVNFRKIYPEPLKSTNDIGKFLKLLGVKYVIFHGDSLDYSNEEILQDLLKQKDLKIVFESNYTYVPENNSNSSLPPDQLCLQFSQSPFKLISPKFLSRGNETEIIIQYIIPENVAEKGYKGKFWFGFSIGLHGFSAGSVTQDKSFFWASVHEQRMLNETNGYAVFNVKVPYKYRGTTIDIYANFYDGGFKRLTPFYFIARLPVFPREIKVPFIVFENEEYNGPIYPSNFTEMVRILDYRQISPVEWEVTVNASSPFILTFTEPYDRLWRAYVNDKEIEPILLHGTINGFPLNETGIVHIRIYYTLQTYYNLGLLISSASFIILAFLCTHRCLLRKLKLLSERIIWLRHKENAGFSFI